MSIEWKCARREVLRCNSYIGYEGREDGSTLGRVTMRTSDSSPPGKPINSLVVLRHGPMISDFAERRLWPKEKRKDVVF